MGNFSVGYSRGLSLRNFNYRSSCTRGIFASTGVGAMVVRNERISMDRDSLAAMDEIHLRILRVTEDLRAIQQELNCAAMQAASDPELMEVLAGGAEIDSLQVLKSALDQMRHFLWFYMQVMTSDSELGDQIRRSLQQDGNRQQQELVEQQFQSATDAIMLRFLADNKHRKPN
jgi:hypothetical protein